MAPSTDSRVLFGTEEPPAEEVVADTPYFRLRRLGGGLGDIRARGVTVLRGIRLVIRDDQWGTLIPRRENERESWKKGWSYAYEGRVVSDRGDRLHFTFDAKIRDGTLIVTVRLTTDTGFMTSRAGLVVLHPIERAVGAPVRVTHSDGSVEDGRFPDLISPGQPFFDIAGIRYEPACGLVADCALAGDVFEMEDQRNWTDASFKTYNRPLAWGSPYTIAAGETVEQSVTLTVTDRVTAPAHGESGTEPTRVVVGGVRGVAPNLGTGIDVHRVGDDTEALETCLRHLRPGHVQLLVDVSEAAVAANVATAGRALAHTDLDDAVWLGVVVPDADDPHTSLERLRRLLADIALSPRGLLVVPAAYLKSYQPNGQWPAGPTPMDCARAARDIFPDARIGGGMLTYFTEVNRCRPVTDEIDYLGHSTAAIVHAAGDSDVMQTLWALPDVFRTGAEIADGLPQRVGMSSIGMWTNPYGRHTAANEAQRRTPMVRADPRQRGLFGAAWHLGYYEAAARARVDALALSSPLPPFAVGDASGWYPVMHVLRGLARARGLDLHDMDNGGDRRVAAVGWRDRDTTELWLANLSTETRPVTVEGMTVAGAARLDAASVTPAARSERWMDHLTPATESVFVLEPYDVVRVIGPAT